MINWENIKTESISNINDIVDNAGAALLDGLTETKIAGVDLQEQCQVALDNYKRACKELTEEESNDIVTKAQTFIDS
jgi:enamine deaminase RidA (YjgF/YER057c/UK114 family)